MLVYHLKTPAFYIWKLLIIGTLEGSRDVKLRLSGRDYCYDYKIFSHSIDSKENPSFPHKKKLCILLYNLPSLPSLDITFIKIKGLEEKPNSLSILTPAKWGEVRWGEDVIVKTVMLFMFTAAAADWSRGDSRRWIEWLNKVGLLHCVWQPSIYYMTLNPRYDRSCSFYPMRSRDIPSVNSI